LIIQHSRDSSLFAIGFYGGEPLLAFDTIKDCVKYAEERAEGREIYFNFTTNGTLLTEVLLRIVVIIYLAENKGKLQ